MLCPPLLVLAALSSFSSDPRAPAQPDFQPIPSVRELGGRLIARPVQPAAAAGRGWSLEELWMRRAEAHRELQRHTILEHVLATDEYVLQLERAGSEELVAAALFATGDFEYVEPDWIVYPVAAAQGSSAQTGPHTRQLPSAPSLCPDDTLFASQWHFLSTRIRGCEGWFHETGDPSITIGICDTGVRTTHQDLQLHRLEGYNAVDRLWESQGGQIGPVYNHGTRTTGVAAANGDNALGVSGVGWNLSHRMLRVSNLANGGAWLTDLQHAARTAVEHGDRVASVSYSGVSSASNLTTASYVKALGGLLVWAAGNEAYYLGFTNRDADDLVIVGATDMIDGLAYFSNYGPAVDLVAPGVNITTTDSAADNAYTSSASGTSFATPMVSGACGLVWSLHPELSPSDVVRLLEQGALDLGASGADDTFGHGRLDLEGALTLPVTAVPHAALGGDVLAGSSPLVVHFRDLSTGAPTSWSWDFGDGSTSTQQNPVHTYTSSGAFTVTLGVANALGADTEVRAGYVLVDVIPPVAEFGAAPTSGLSPLPVQFTDLSSGGQATQWLWSFGDGATSTAQNPLHVYTSSGNFNVQLTASNPYGSDSMTKYSYIGVNYIPPVANFGGTPTSGNSPLVVQFTDQSTGGTPTAWTWVFGDGGVSTLQNPSHTYTQPGTYSVRLTAGNAYGSNQLERVGYVSVGQGPPILADFVGTPTSGGHPLTVSFTDLSIGTNINTWEWDFGDGGTSTLRNPTHTYTAAGDYDVTLQVWDAADNEDQCDKLSYVTVQ